MKMVFNVRRALVWLVLNVLFSIFLSGALDLFSAGEEVSVAVAVILGTAHGSLTFLILNVLAFEASDD